MCEASAAFLLATAPALLVSSEPVVSCPATLATMEHNAEKGEGEMGAAGRGVQEIRQTYRGKYLR